MGNSTGQSLRLGGYPSGPKPPPEAGRAVERLQSGFLTDGPIQWMMTGELKALSPESIPSVIRIIGLLAETSRTNRSRLIQLLQSDLDPSALQMLRKAIGGLHGL